MNTDLATAQQQRRTASSNLIFPRKLGKFGHFFTAFRMKFPLPESIIVRSFKKNPIAILDKWPYRKADSNTKAAILSAQNPIPGESGNALDEKRTSVAKLLSMQNSMFCIKPQARKASNSKRTGEDYPQAPLNNLKLLLEKETSELLKMELEAARLKNRSQLTEI